MIDFVGTGGPNDGGYERCEIWATGPRCVAPTESTPNPTYPDLSRVHRTGAGAAYGFVSQMSAPEQ